MPTAPDVASPPAPAQQQRLAGVRLQSYCQSRTPDKSAAWWHTIDQRSCPPWMPHWRLCALRAATHLPSSSPHGTVKMPHSDDWQDIKLPTFDAPLVARALRRAAHFAAIVARRQAAAVPGSHEIFKHRPVLFCRLLAAAVESRGMGGKAVGTAAAHSLNICRLPHATTAQPTLSSIVWQRGSPEEAPLCFLQPRRKLAVLGEVRIGINGLDLHKSKSTAIRKSSVLAVLGEVRVRVNRLHLHSQAAATHCALSDDICTVAVQPHRRQQ